MAQQLSNQRIAWFNGKFMPENQVMIPFRDRSWKYGDGAFDMTRTFEGQPFRLKEHIDRFYRSLRYLQIDPGIGPKEMVAHSEEVVARNEHLRAAAGDWWVGQRVSRGVDAVGDLALVVRITAALGDQRQGMCEVRIAEDLAF